MEASGTFHSPLSECCHSNNNVIIGVIVNLVHMQPRRYTFTQVLDEYSQQEEAFAVTTLQSIRDMLQMKSNSLIFTLGVTNSGKVWGSKGAFVAMDMY
jgi:hypothetical protein